VRLGPAPALLLLALAVAPPPARSQIAVPELGSRVTDLTGTLGRSDESTIEDRLRAFEEKHGSQIAVLIVPTTEPETIEQYSMRVAESWKLGRKGIDDGALLLVALKDRAIRIEVGYGLEGVLNDATCKRIVAEIITPEFRRGDFRAGIEAGVEQMMRVIEGESLPPLRHGERHGGDASNLLFFLAVVAIGAAHALRPVLGRLGAALVIGLGAAIISSFLVSSSAALLIGAAVFVLALFASPAGAWVNGRRYAGGGGFGPGSSGGGFSGGGGGFGGGGASGRW
jgi:uncharacterized protein